MTRFGLLPLALPAAVVVAARLGALAFPPGREGEMGSGGGDSADRAIGGGTLAAALVVVGVRLLGALDLLTPAVLASALGIVTVALVLVRRDVRFLFPWRSAVSAGTAPLLLVTTGAVGLAGLAATWLPVWQWDALGYHLPYVDFALQAQGTGGVPVDVPYVSTYPHDIEFLFLALRAMLPDDRLVDLGQIPLGLFGAVATAGIARRLDASRPLAVAAGAAWLVVPAVFLQLPSDYIDVGAAAFLLAAAYFVLSPPSPRRLVLAGVALGLFLGTKPNAPVATAIVGGLLVVRGVRARQPGRLSWPLAVALALVVALGGETYLANLVRHGNPVWPVAMTLGPLELPGTTPMQSLLDAGAAAPRLHGPVLSRVLRSWIALDSAPIFDMRIGGYGPLFLLALVPLGACVLTTLRRREPTLAILVVATLASPDPAVARYVLAFPALALAAGAATLSTAPRLALGDRARLWRDRLGRLGAIAAAALAVEQIHFAYPGLTGEGPPLGSYVHMSESERAVAVGAAGSPEPIFEARARVRAGESFAFDKSFELGHLAWPSDLHGRASWLPDGLDGAAFGDRLARENASVVAVADETPAGTWLKEHPERFFPLFPCRSMPCTVYARR